MITRIRNKITVTQKQGDRMHPVIESNMFFIYS